MGLSNKIRALIGYANETTGAEDASLGECVRTLVEGYNGGNNIPSQLMVIPQGKLSSQIASLLAYANEATGAEDTRIGDAIKTLCDGYGGGDKPVFYERLITDGNAYIDTGLAVGQELYDDASYLADIKFVQRNYNDNILGMVYYNSRVVRLEVTISNRIRCFYENNTTAHKYGEGGPSYITLVNGNRYLFEAKTKDGWYMNGEKIGTFPTPLTGRNSNTLVLFGVMNQNKTVTTAPANSAVFQFKVTLANGTEKMNLRPCTYKGEAGMWDLVSNTFYGNASTTGAFTVEGLIGE